MFKSFLKCGSDWIAFLLNPMLSIYATFSEEKTVSIDKGRCADFVVHSVNIIQMTSKKLQNHDS